MEAIIAIDENQRIVIFNPMAERLFCCPASEALGTPLERFVPERFRSAHAAHVRQFSVTGVSGRNGRVGSADGRQATHIARELHDDLGQQLTALKMDILWRATRTLHISSWSCVRKQTLRCAHH